MLSDLTKFFKQVNLYPTEKEMQILFARLDKDGDQCVTLKDFGASITPFLNMNN